MKKLLLLLLGTSFLISSCSDDDGENNSEGTVLNKIRIKTYGLSQQGPVLAQIDYYNYSEGLISTHYSHRPDDSVMAYRIYQYNPQGLLSEITTFSGDDDALSQTETFTYDAGGRLTQYVRVTDAGFLDTVRTFTYNDDNTITCTASEGTETSKTYYLNDDNLIYKEVSEEGMYELVLDGANTLSATSSQGTKTFTYDDDHDRSLLGIINPTGNYKPNAILAAGGLRFNETLTADKYLLTIMPTGPHARNYEYVFNGTGRPASANAHFDDDENSVAEAYTYYYE